MEFVRSKATGTLLYEIYFNDDQSECIVLERYRDSQALVEHAGHLGDLGRAIPGLVSSELLGEPSDDVRAKLVGSGVRLFRPFLCLEKAREVAMASWRDSTSRELPDNAGTGG